jgi:hypothetical protein
VTGSKVKRDTLRGRDIREFSLAKVPAARRADVASNATSAGTANSATTANSANTANTANNANALQGRGRGDFVSSGEYKQVLVRMQAGDERELVRNGPISVYARCATVGPNDQLRMFAKTDVDGAIMLASWGDTLDGTNAGDFLNTTTPEANREFDSSASGNPGGSASAVTPTGVTKIIDHYDDNYLIAPTGHAIAWESEAELLLFNYLGARCLIAGTVHLYRLG